MQQNKAGVQHRKKEPTEPLSKILLKAARQYKVNLPIFVFSPQQLAGMWSKEANEEVDFAELLRLWSGEIKFTMGSSAGIMLPSGLRKIGEC